MENHPPILLVHGIWDSATRIAPLAGGPSALGLGSVSSFDLLPNDGSATISALARQLGEQAEQLCVRHACERIRLEPPQRSVRHARPARGHARFMLSDARVHALVARILTA